MNFQEKIKELGLPLKKMGDLPNKFRDDEEVIHIFNALIRFGDSGVGKEYWFGITQNKMIGWGKFMFKEDTITTLLNRVEAIDTNYGLGGGTLTLRMAAKDLEIAGKVKKLKEVEQILSDLIN